MSLVEVLVTLVSTSVGLLGIAALQLVSVKSNHEAQARLQATALTASMLDSMRANRAGVLSGEYRAIAFNATGNALTVAGADLAAWQREIDRILPGGSLIAAGAIEQPANSNLVVITIRWGQEASDAASSRSNALTTRAEL
jgi:type IV pilus assembly protein PilV